MKAYETIKMIESGWLNGGQYITKGTVLKLVEQPNSYNDEITYKGVDVDGRKVEKHFYGMSQLLNLEEDWFIQF